MPSREVAIRTARTLTISLAMFAVHYMVFGKSEGFPDRSSLALGTITLFCFTAGPTWSTRWRFLFASPIIFLGLGVYLRVFADQHPVHVLAWMVLSVPFCLGYWYLTGRFNKLER